MGYSLRPRRCVKSIDVGFKARHVYLSTVLGLHFVQLFWGEESTFENVVPDLATFYTVDILLRLRASVRIGSRRKGVGAPPLADDPTGLETRFELWTRRGEIRRSIDGHWALALGLGQRRELSLRRALERLG